jgi:site-specific recombinase XerD
VPSFGGIRLHDLRHSFASFAVQSGGSLYLVGKVLGHKQSRTTEMYAHAADEPLLATAELAAQRIARALGNSKKPDQRRSSAAGQS